jgi:ankyrin repeat protein
LGQLTSVNVQNTYGYSPLHFAVFQRDRRLQEDVFRELLDADADPSLRNVHGKTPLQHAKVSGSRALVKLLTDHGPHALRRGRYAHPVDWTAMVRMVASMAMLVSLCCDMVVGQAAGAANFSRLAGSACAAASSDCAG